MVSFQHLSQQYHVIGSFISQVINLVMPGYMTGAGTINQAAPGDTHDAFYFYQYLKLQYQGHGLT